ncbi:MAG TPA: GNAT family N-acetyltransferase [Devosia sp.]|jgi:predicted GNAT family N-acyltransferase|nr:GNAT family N-acetyltransferase [Devosia sp.]
MPQPLLLKVPFHSDLGRLALEVRRQVFMLEQNVPESVERDAYDQTATHIVAIVDGNVVGVLRLLFLPEHVKIGRVAVVRERRGLGIAGAMMRFAMAEARAAGATRFALTAQMDKVAMYEKLGFTAYGERFEEGGMPHLAMKTY